MLQRKIYAARAWDNVATAHKLPQKPSYAWSTVDGLLVVDGGGCIEKVYAQCERKFGYPLGELIGCPGPRSRAV